VVLALILTGLLAFEAGAFVALLRLRRERAASSRAQRATDVVWMAIPLAAVLVLAARSWLAVFDLA